MTHRIIKHDCVQLATSSAPGADRSLSASTPGQRIQASQKGVRLIHKDQDVRAIEITCACGGVTVIELQYPADPAQ
ncbi:MAG: hypothetical protein ABGY71_08740 [bacterium]|jgi:hypothetical protein|nr:hypothetical protein [Planctomycetota bacterium]HIL52403.1 hypothetical protein [Planctomycetota bacterium]